jgi:hexulose-6-phosphate isomerase
MKKAVNIWSFRTGSLREAFSLAKKAGFKGLELALAEEGELNLRTSEKELAAIKQAAAGEGIALFSVASGLYWKYSLTSPDPKQRNKAAGVARRQLETAAYLGCDTILLIPGAVSVGFAPELGVVDYGEAYKRALEALGELAPYAEKHKVHIGVENVWNNFLLSPLEMASFIDAVGSPYVGSYFDVGNVLPQGYPEQWIRILGKRIRKVHFKDFKRNAYGLEGFVNLLEGDVNWPEVMKAFDEIGYKGWCTGEISPYAHYPDQVLFNTSASMDRIFKMK